MCLQVIVPGLSSFSLYLFFKTWTLRQGVMSLVGVVSACLHHKTFLPPLSPANYHGHTLVCNWILFSTVCIPYSSSCDWAVQVSQISAPISALQPSLHCCQRRSSSQGKFFPFRLSLSNDKTIAHRLNGIRMTRRLRQECWAKWMWSMSQTTRSPWPSSTFSPSIEVSFNSFCSTKM